MDENHLRLRELHQRWRLTADSAPFRTHSSLLQPVLYRGLPAMVKIALCQEEYQGGLVMQFWNGEGAARVYDRDDEALLLERAACQRSLAGMVAEGKDDEATRILCEVVNRLHQHKAPASLPLTPLSQRLAALEKATTTPYLRAAAIARELLSDPQPSVVLHGDIHHANIIDADRGWIAIDPKGLSGERGYDFANILCNPDEATALTPGRLLRQVDIIAECSALDRQRLLAWVAVHGALSAAWLEEDGADPGVRLAVSQTAMVLSEGKRN